METQSFVEKVQEEFGVIMENPEKVTRAVDGMVTGKGFVGGVGKDASARTILDKYDELGGYITKNSYKVKTGCFFDRKTRKSVEKPVITLLIRVNGEWVEQVEGEPEPLEVKVAKEQIKKTKTKKTNK